ncbi:molybdopterin biosynthesis protein [Nannocystis pusilla]|uniref:Molybdopterin molybdenumtransferase n=1 Tax=Nannocystis pusilla TaxID=889268 RepID=A0ABS7TZN8_9BACT|nr:molybdopterin biosynthesis protein [Nannocystis pusilla]
MTEQRQFLQVVDPDVAVARWWAAARPVPLASEELALADLCGRVLAEAVASPRDVPGFDRSNVDGYAVRAGDTYGAGELAPARLRLRPEVVVPGVPPDMTLGPGEAVAIATGGAVVRGADAVVMVEDTDEESGILLVRRPVVPGAMIAVVGGDITRGEVVLRPGVRLGPRETAVLAAVGRAAARVVRRPRVGILSTGDELVAPGGRLLPGQVHDCNQTFLADSVRELGGEPLALGVVGDDPAALDLALRTALHERRCDVLLLSGGTSKGAGDLSAAAVARLPGPAPAEPAVCVHGVALKPGKPLCLAVTAVGEQRVPIAVLPGFPTSALFTFHEFVAPLLRALAGLRAAAAPAIAATLPHDLASERGRREYALVQLLAGPKEHALESMSVEEGPLKHVPEDTLPIALPTGKGSGSVTAFCRADGFIAVPRQTERLLAGAAVEVRPIDRDAAAPDLVIAGSHCTGLERLVDRLHAQGLTVRLLAQGSQGGLAAAARGLCDVAPIHLLDPDTDEYNRAFVPDGCDLVPGYGRMQGLVSRKDDPRFPDPVAGARFELPACVRDPEVFLVNRNRGSGTRLLLDALLGPGPRPSGYSHEARSHSGVAACVASGRADWGVAIASVADAVGLRFAAIRLESYDFVIPRARRPRRAVQLFLAALADPEVRADLRAAGFVL